MKMFLKLLTNKSWTCTSLQNVAAAHQGKPSLTLRPGAGALCDSTGLRPSGVQCNGCLRQPMRTFFYCDSHESQQRGKTPRVNIQVNNFTTFLINFLAISGNFEQLCFFSPIFSQNFFSKISSEKFWSKISENIFDQFSRHFRQFPATFLFLHFLPIFFITQ